MKTIQISVLLLTAVIFSQCAVVNQTAPANNNTTAQNSTPNTIKEDENDPNEWYYIPGTYEHTAIEAEKGYGDAIGAESDYSKIKTLTVSLGFEQNQLPNNLAQLVNLEKISINRLKKDKSDLAIDNQLKMDLSTLLKMNSLRAISLYNLVPDFGSGMSSSNLKELSITTCILNEMPKFIPTSSLTEIYLGHSKVKDIEIGKLPATLDEFKYNGLSDSQEVEIVSQFGLDKMYPNPKNIPKKFTFSSDDFTADELMSNKDKVMRLFIFLDSNSMDYFKALNSFDNLEQLYVTERQSVASTGDVFAHYILPDEVFNCSKLTIFRLSSDRIEEINGDFSVMNKLRSLKLDCPLNKLTPFKVEGLETLELNVLMNYSPNDPSPSIDLMYYQKVGPEIMSKRQANLDEVLKNHPNLNVLKIQGSNGFDLTNPFSIESLKDYTQLKEIQIEMFYIPEFPLFVLNNPDLKAIRFKNLYFKSIPEGIGSLTKLVELKFSTSAASLPDDIFTLPNLLSLVFSAKNTTTLNGLFMPNALPKLKTLSVTSTKVPLDKFKTFKKNNAEVKVSVDMKRVE